MSPKVSVIIPVYNVERFLGDCLDSAIAQTLSDIEIICVNDGSTDGSLALLKQYAERDDRIKIIDKANAGYGAGMNDGLDAATGEYVAFLESDDQIATGAYRRLSLLADQHGVDIIKGNYYNMVGFDDGRQLEEIRLTKIDDRYGKVFRPLDNPWSFYIPMMNCLGLFRRKFLEKNQIRHNETPGAAHQDMGFWFQTLCCADSMYLVDEPFYMYRQDNENSSMKNDKTAFFTLGEYDFMMAFLERRETLKAEAMPVYSHRKFGSCMFAYDNSELSIKLPFARALSESFSSEIESGCFSFSRYSERDKEKLLQLVEDPDAFYLNSLDKECEVSGRALSSMKAEIERLNMLLDNTQFASCNNKGEAKFAQQSDGVDTPTLSIVIPVYNAGDYLEKCLDSVKSQQFQDYEVICVNDGSTDNSADILQRYANEDCRFTVISQDNKGQGFARNVGMRVSRGRYIQFVDSDDELANGALGALVNRMEIDDLQILFFDGKVIVDSSLSDSAISNRSNPYERKRCYGSGVSGSEMLVKMSRDNAYRVSPCMAIFDRRYLTEQGVAFPEYMIYEDNVFMAKALIPASRVGHVNEPYYLRRLRGGSTTTSSVSAFHVQSYFRVYLELLAYSRQCTMPLDAAQALAKEMRAIATTLKRYYLSLSKVQREIASALPPAEKEILMALVGSDLSSPSKGKKTNDEIARIHASNSWRIGRAITSFPRWVKRSMKKANGK